MNERYEIRDLVFKNRVIVPPMASQTASKEGLATAKTIEHYKILASSHASMVMVEYSYISQAGKSEPFQLGISDDNHISGLNKIASSIKESKTIAAIQIVHAGGKSSSDLTLSELIAPSAIATPVKGIQLETPSEANQEDISKIKNDFLAAVKRAVIAGFDVVEIHAAHGYGLNQWISPITNQRTDSYGKTLNGRSKILFEIVSSIKHRNPKLILSVRLPGQDYLEGGLTLDDSSRIAIELEKRGVDIINVSSGIGGWRRPRHKKGEGYLVADAKIIQKALSIPVIGVGGIKTAQYIEKIIENKDVTFLAVGRSILDNNEWGKKVGLME